jgi:hypothetical protein
MNTKLAASTMNVPARPIVPTRTPASAGPSTELRFWETPSSAAAAGNDSFRISNGVAERKAGEPSA